MCLQTAGGVWCRVTQWSWQWQRSYGLLYRGSWKILHTTWEFPFKEQIFPKPWDLQECKCTWAEGKSPGILKAGPGQQNERPLAPQDNAEWRKSKSGTPSLTGEGDRVWSLCAADQTRCVLTCSPALFQQTDCAERLWPLTAAREWDHLFQQCHCLPPQGERSCSTVSWQYHSVIKHHKSFWWRASY